MKTLECPLMLMRFLWKHLRGEIIRNTVYMLVTDAGLTWCCVCLTSSGGIYRNGQLVEIAEKALHSIYSSSWARQELTSA